MNPALLEPARWAAEDVNHANELLMAAAREGRALEARRHALLELLASTQARTTKLLEQTPLDAVAVERARAALLADAGFEAWLQAHTAAHLKAFPIPEVVPPPHTPSPEHTARLQQMERDRAARIGTSSRPGRDVLQLGWVVVGVVLPLLPFLPYAAALLLASVALLAGVVTSAIAFAKGRRTAALALAVVGAVGVPALAILSPVLRATLAAWLA